MRFLKTKLNDTKRIKTFFALLPITIKNTTQDGEGYVQDTRWLEKVSVQQFRSTCSDVWYNEKFVENEWVNEIKDNKFKDINIQPGYNHIPIELYPNKLEEMVLWDNKIGGPCQLINTRSFGFSQTGYGAVPPITSANDLDKMLSNISPKYITLNQGTDSKSFSGYRPSNGF